MGKRTQQPAGAAPETPGANTAIPPQTASIAPGAPANPAPAEQPKVKKPQKTEFAVHKDGSHVRTYSVAVHGENAEDLAKEFVAHHGGEIL